MGFVVTLFSASGSIDQFWFCFLEDGMRKECAPFHLQHGICHTRCRRSSLSRDGALCVCMCVYVCMWWGLGVDGSFLLLALGMGPRVVP